MMSATKPQTIMASGSVVQIDAAEPSGEASART